MNTLRNLITGQLTDAEADRIELGAAAFGVIVLGWVLILATVVFMGGAK